MMSLNHRILSAAAVLLLTGGSTFGQAVTAQSNAAQQKDVLTPSVMQNYTPPPYTLPWAPLLESEIQTKIRVWRTVDLRDKENIAFAANVNTQKKSLIDVLMEAVFSGKVKAFNASEGGKLTKELSRSELIKLISPGNGGNGYNPANVIKYEIKEDWLLLKENGTMLVRIVAIAPVIEVKAADGTIAEQPLFWLFYPDCRTYLAQTKVDAGAFPGKFSWDELFEMRIFKSKINKTASPIWQTPVPVK